MRSDKGQNWFIIEVAKRADFTRGDVQLIWNTIEELFYEMASEAVEYLEKNEEEEFVHSLCVNGLFDFKVKKVRAHLAYDARNRKHVYIKNTYRYSFKPSRGFVRKITYKLSDLRSEE